MLPGACPVNIWLVSEATSIARYRIQFFFFKLETLLFPNPVFANYCSMVVTKAGVMRSVEPLIVSFVPFICDSPTTFHLRDSCSYQHLLPLCKWEKGCYSWMLLFSSHCHSILFWCEKSMNMDVVWKEWACSLRSRAPVAKQLLNLLVLCIGSLSVQFSKQLVCWLRRRFLFFFFLGGGCEQV